MSNMEISRAEPGVAEDWDSCLESLYTLDNDTVYTTLSKGEVIFEGLPPYNFDLSSAIRHLNRCASVHGLDTDEIMEMMEVLTAQTGEGRAMHVVEEGEIHVPAMVLGAAYLPTIDEDADFPFWMIQSNWTKHDGTSSKTNLNKEGTALKRWSQTKSMEEYRTTETQIVSKHALSEASSSGEQVNSSHAIATQKATPAAVTPSSTAQQKPPVTGPAKEFRQHDERRRWWFFVWHLIQKIKRKKKQLRNKPTKCVPQTPFHTSHTRPGELLNPHSRSERIAMANARWVKNSSSLDPTSEESASETTEDSHPFLVSTGSSARLSVPLVVGNSAEC